MAEQEPTFERRVEPRWVLTERPRPELLDEIRAGLNIPNVMAKILINRGIDTVDAAREFLYPSLDHLINPFQMIDMEKAVTRIWKAIDAGEKMMIHGDYDVDGVTGTSVLVRSIGHLGAEVTFYIPNRLEAGYGISKEAIDACGERGVSLLISVDCGITAVQETEYARSCGVDVIITDHHQPGELPNAVAVVDPKRPDCSYPFKELPGVALAFKLADALYLFRKLDPGPVYRNLDLVALGCAADVVPLVDENRVLVAQGLKEIEQTRNPGLRALLRKLNLVGRQLGTGQLIFVIAPRINALGRMGSALEAVTMLTTEDEERAMEIADLLEEKNQLRRQVDERMYREAIDMVDGEVDLKRDKAIVLWSDDWHPGVIGIVASRIAERVHLPTVLISMEGNSGKGSARSIPGFDLFGALSRCRPHLMSFGGHKYAAGLSVERSNLPAFRDALLGAAHEMLDLDDMTPKLEIDDEITLDQIDSKLIEILNRFGPFGPLNTRPIMVSRGVEVVGNPAVVGRNHIRFKARQNGSMFDCIGYNLGHLTYRLTPGEANLDMAYVIEENEWRGRRDIQLRLRDLR
jgi:single-stranded-DNA-specific exonuclease